MSLIDYSLLTEARKRIEKVFLLFEEKRFKVVYFPSEYEDIADYLIANWGIVEYQKHEEEVQRVINQIIRHNKKFPFPKPGPLVDAEYCLRVLRIVDYTLDLLGYYQKTAENRAECANNLFPHFDSNSFHTWLVNQEKDSNDKNSMMD